MLLKLKETPCSISVVKSACSALYHNEPTKIGISKTICLYHVDAGIPAECLGIQYVRTRYNTHYISCKCNAIVARWEKQMLAKLTTLLIMTFESWVIMYRLFAIQFKIYVNWHNKILCKKSLVDRGSCWVAFSLSESYSYLFSAIMIGPWINAPSNVYFANRFMNA